MTDHGIEPSANKEYAPPCDYGVVYGEYGLGVHPHPGHLVRAQVGDMTGENGLPENHNFSSWAGTGYCLPAFHHSLVGHNISELGLLVLWPRQDIVLLKLQVDGQTGGDQDEEEDNVVVDEEEEEEEGLHDHCHPPSPPPDWRPPG